MYYTILEIPPGNIFLAKTSKGLSIAHFIPKKKQTKKTSELLEEQGYSTIPDENKFQEEKRLFELYFRGKPVDFSFLPLDLISGTSYQKSVWLEARKIPYGKTETYKSLAQKLNHQGFRSVGRALGQNPLLVVIPCHRVLRSDGSLGGFSAGLELKKYLLELERRATQPSGVSGF